MPFSIFSKVKSRVVNFFEKGEKNIKATIRSLGFYILAKTPASHLP